MFEKKQVNCNLGDLPPHKRVICQILENARRPLTAYEVANYGNMGWSTAKKHLEELSEKGIGICSRTKSRIKLYFIE